VSAAQARSACEDGVSVRTHSKRSGLVEWCGVDNGDEMW
jgi:hypothetical protein